MKKILLAITVLAGLSAGAQTPRMSLYEEFTGETCPPCAQTNPGLNKILLDPINQTKVIPIKWQVPIPSPPSNTWSLYQTNKNDINWRYRSVANGGYGYISQNTAATATSSGINSAPQGVMDGQHQWVFGAASDHPAYINNNVISNAQAIMSAFSVDMKHEWSDATRSTIIVTVNITASANFNAVGALVFRCVMVERLITFSVQPGTNGEKVFEDVAISAYPTLQGGTSMVGNWTTGQNQTFVLTCALPSYVRKKEEISMVGFIQDDGNRRVAQACRSKALYDAVAVNADLDPSCGSNFAPAINVENDGANAITNMTITPYVDGVAGTDINWTGNLAAGASSMIVLGSQATPGTSGSHTFSYNIVAINGIDFDATNNYKTINFPVYNGGGGNAVVEGFPNTAFPPAGWTNVNGDGGSGFTRNTQAGGYWLAPMNAVKYDCYNNTKIGDVDELYLPGMNLEGGDAVDMTFDYAYAQRNTNSNDKLEVMVSDNCGTSWTTVYSKSGANLATASAPFPSGAFIPDQNEFTQWQTVQVSLPGTNKSSVLAKFVVTNDNGNNIYLDNVNLKQNAPSGIKENRKASHSEIFPNPTNGDLNIRTTTENGGELKIAVVNMVGQTVYAGSKNLEAGENSLSVDLKFLTSGIYFVQLENNGVSSTQKLTITK